MADRISNLQPPPEHWNAELIKNYKQQCHSRSWNCFGKEESEYPGQQIGNGDQKLFVKEEAMTRLPLD
ncbi:MAG: hypothetical protein U5K51_05825 [Flavobacteriaceae bacterium]|nr:hypothetical protein [Flavobacteriaceae bacterium]